MHIRQPLLAAALLLAASSSYAATASLSLSDKPNNLIVANDTGSAQFSITSSDLANDAIGKTLTLTSIDYITTHYPNNTGETVELCYFRPYNSTAAECKQINPNSSSTLPDFNDQIFGNGAKVIIRHKAGGPTPAYPAGDDSVTYHYSY